MSHKSSLSPVKWTCKKLVSECVWLLTFTSCFFFFGMKQSIACMQKDTHTHTHLHTEPQVIFILARGRWESRKNNQVGLHILFSQTSSKLSPSPSSRVLWASSNRQHQSHFIRLARLSPPIFPGKCLTSPPEPQSKLKRGLCTYVVRSQLIVCAADWTSSWSRNRLAYGGDQALKLDNWVTVVIIFVFKWTRYGDIQVAHWMHSIRDFCQLSISVS